MWIKRGLQSAKSDDSQLCPTNDFLYRQKIVDTMAESMDTSEILADEDDRKLFVGGLPQVWDTCWHTSCFAKFALKLQTVFCDISQGWKTNVYSFQDAKQEDISVHFQTFGEIDNINIKTDPATGRSR